MLPWLPSVPSFLLKNHELELLQEEDPGLKTIYNITWGEESWLRWIPLLRQNEHCNVQCTSTSDTLHTGTFGYIVKEISSVFDSSTWRIVLDTCYHYDWEIDFFSSMWSDHETNARIYIKICLSVRLSVCVCADVHAWVGLVFPFSLPYLQKTGWRRSSSDLPSLCYTVLCILCGHLWKWAGHSGSNTGTVRCYPRSKASVAFCTCSMNSCL